MTTINLRKANALSKALLDEARKLSLPTVGSVSIYAEGDFAPAIEGLGVKLRQNLADAQALLDAGYKLRALMSAAFQSSGISDLLAEKALLDAREKLITKVVDKDSQFTSASTLELAQPRLTALKEAQSSAVGVRAYHGADSLNVRVPDAAFAGLDDDLRAIRRRKSDISDRLLELNTTTKVLVPADVDALATRFKVA